MNLQIIVHRNNRVLTTTQLAESYGTDVKVISNNFTRNADRYSEGKHFIRLTGNELRDFKAIHQIDEHLKFASTLYLWTEKGAWLHAKSLNTDEAWDAYEMLVDSYYNIQEVLTAEQQLRKQLELSLMTSDRVDKVEKKVSYLYDTMRIDGVQQQMLNELGKNKVLRALGGYESPAYKVIGRKAFKQLWRDFKKHFVIPRYSELPKAKYDVALRFIELWQPETSLLMEIESLNRQATMTITQQEGLPCVQYVEQTS